MSRNYDWLDLGGNPHEEPFPQVGRDNAYEIMRITSIAFRDYLKRLFPDGEFKVIREISEYGDYLSVGAKYYYSDDMEPHVSHAAYTAEKYLPAKWDEIALQYISEQLVQHGITEEQYKEACLL